MPLPLALLAIPGGSAFKFGRKAVRKIGKLFGGRRRRRRRARRAAAQSQTNTLMRSVPTRTAVGRGLSFLSQQAEARFLGIGSKKKQEEAVALAQTPQEIIKKYWWVLAIIFGFFFLRKNKMI